MLPLLLLLLLAIPLEDTQPGGLQKQYDYALRLFQRGYLENSQYEAEQGYRQFKVPDPTAAVRFQLLEAESMLFRGLYSDALRVLANFLPGQTDPEGTVRKLAIEAVALTREEQLDQADRKLVQADALCRAYDNTGCGTVMRAHGILAVQKGQLALAHQSFLDTVVFAQSHHDPWLGASASVNLGWTGIHTGHFDEAVDWSKAAVQGAEALGAEDLAQSASGNLGWAYYQLGDEEGALSRFLEAEKSAAKLGDFGVELKWISTAGYVYRDRGDLARATQSYRRAFELAKQIDSKEDIVNALEDLAQVSVDSGKLDEATAYLAQVIPMELAGGNHLTANVLLTQGMLAAARRQDKQAESLLREVQDNQQNPTTTRLGAGEQLALLFEAEGKSPAAEQMYKSTLNAFDSAQAELKSEESNLPFVANAARIYDDYIHLLLQQGRNNDALAVADRSRARTLAQSLGSTEKNGAAKAAAMDPRQIARKTGSTLLFYWLGQKQSCLWAITPAKIAFFPLPPQVEIASKVDRYSKAVLDYENPLADRNVDGQDLYRSLVAPAAALIRPDTPVMILADGALSRLNFETLLVPGAAAKQDGNSGHNPGLHYWIDDATLISAPSLAMLAVARPVQSTARNLLLLGNPVAPSEEFASLPFFGFEVTRIQKHFDPKNVTAFTLQQATPAAYLHSSPAHYAYIHFVAHAVSSRTDPLDSAIILSNGSPGPDSYKLYARDIMQHPVDARLVTISACYGSGTRSYAGEGLVGLSWAFLRAGAHSVIGALWEVADDSSPRLMDALYQGIEDGQPPATALRNSKLLLLHSNSRFATPFYWAPFQIYSSQ
ncbi:MAG: CHAT domain-containing protein [Terracidiphilus sp.]|jgi:CHAT domain-containing protein